MLILVNFAYPIDDLIAKNRNGVSGREVPVYATIGGIKYPITEGYVVGAGSSTPGGIVLPNTNNKRLAVAHSNDPCLTVFNTYVNPWKLIPYENETDWPAGNRELNKEDFPEGYWGEAPYNSNGAIRCAINPSGTHVAVSHAGPPFLSVYDITGTVLKRLPTPVGAPMERHEYVRSDGYSEHWYYPVGIDIKYSPNGKHLVVCVARIPTDQNLGQVLSVYDATKIPYTKISGPTPPNLQIHPKTKPNSWSMVGSGVTFNNKGTQMAYYHGGLGCWSEYQVGVDYKPYSPITFYNVLGDSYSRSHGVPGFYGAEGGRSGKYSFSPDDKYFAAFHSHDVAVFDAKTGQSISGLTQQSPALNIDGNTVNPVIEQKADNSGYMAYIHPWYVKSIWYNSDGSRLFVCGNPSATVVRAWRVACYDTTKGIPYPLLWLYDQGDNYTQFRDKSRILPLSISSNWVAVRAISAYASETSDMDGVPELRLDSAKNDIFGMNSETLSYRLGFVDDMDWW